MIRSVAFRQAVVYALLFSASAIALFGFFYWSTAGYMTRQAEATIEAERAAFAERYRNEGLNGLTELIRQRLARQPAGDSIYLLASPDYRSLIGNLSGWPDVEPDAEGWVRFRLTGGEGPDDEVRWASAKAYRLAGDFNLLIGRDMQELEATRSAIVRTLFWGLGITVLMALAGGAMMARSTSSRVRDFNVAIEQIMSGRLSERIPTVDTDDEFDLLAGNLNRMLDEIERLMDGVRQVSDNIAHDLKTPLARLRNRLETLREGGGDPTAAPGEPDDRAAIEEAIAEADALLTTFNALLRIARIEATSRRERFERVELAALVADVAELYEPLAEERGQRIEVEVGTGVVVNGDRDLLFQALANLVDNAIKYAPESGRIGIALDAAGESALLAVTDDGPGIPANEREQVFERFWRGDDSRSTPGSGLGLSLVEAVARLHGATVELADNRPGLRVALRIPAVTS